MLWDLKTTLIHTCRKSKPSPRKMRSDIYWFAEICNSQCLSHFAASFIASRAEVSIVKGMFECFVTASNQMRKFPCRSESKFAFSTRYTLYEAVELWMALPRQLLVSLGYSPNHGGAIQQTSRISSQATVNPLREISPLYRLESRLSSPPATEVQCGIRAFRNSDIQWVLN